MTSLSRPKELFRFAIRGGAPLGFFTAMAEKPGFSSSIEMFVFAVEHDNLPVARMMAKLPNGSDIHWAALRNAVDRRNISLLVGLQKIGASVLHAEPLSMHLHAYVCRTGDYALLDHVEPIILRFERLLNFFHVCRTGDDEDVVKHLPPHTNTNIHCYVECLAYCDRIECVKTFREMLRRRGRRLLTGPPERNDRIIRMCMEKKSPQVSILQELLGEVPVIRNAIFIMRNCRADTDLWLVGYALRTWEQRDMQTDILQTAVSNYPLPVVGFMLRRVRDTLGPLDGMMGGVLSARAFSRGDREVMRELFMSGVDFSQMCDYLVDPEVEPDTVESISDEIIFDCLRYGSRFPHRYLSLVTGLPPRELVVKYLRWIHAGRVIYWMLGREVKEYLLSPCGRMATEDIEMCELEKESGEEKSSGEMAAARLELRARRDELIRQVSSRPDLSRGTLLERYREVRYADGSGMRNLCGGARSREKSAHLSSTNPDFARAGPRRPTGRARLGPWRDRGMKNDACHPSLACLV